MILAEVAKVRIFTSADAEVIVSTLIDAGVADLDSLPPELAQKVVRALQSWGMPYEVVRQRRDAVTPEEWARAWFNTKSIQYLTKTWVPLNTQK